MPAVFLGDPFSLNKPGYYGMAFANHALLKAIFLCEEISHVVSMGDPRWFAELSLPNEVKAKLVTTNSIKSFVDSFQTYKTAAAFCSSFGPSYSDLIDFRNSHSLRFPVYGFTHSISYQETIGVLYKIFVSNPTPQDAILCTSTSAVSAMEKFIASVASTMSMKAAGPRLVHFPLAYEAGSDPKPKLKSNKHFQVLYVGRLDWETKADLLVIPAVLAHLPKDHNIRFVIAGAAQNKAYLDLLRRACAPYPVTFLTDISNEQKQALYHESDVMFSPSDNYQETFGLTVLEAKHHGCVPVVSDFDGYRDLVNDGTDGYLLRTVAAPIPDLLRRVQMITSRQTYHGWWAVGVSIDPKQAARVLYDLSNDRQRWTKMSVAAMESVAQYTVKATAKRFGKLLQERPESNNLPVGSERYYKNPCNINYADIFQSYPSAFWQDQLMQLTDAGSRFLVTPHINGAPQLLLLQETVTVGDVVKLLTLVRQGAVATICLEQGIEPIIMSIALKNGLITIS